MVLKLPNEKPTLKMKRSHPRPHSLYDEGWWKGQATLTTQLKIANTGYAQSCLPSADRFGNFCSLKCPCSLLSLSARRLIPHTVTRCSLTWSSSWIVFYSCIAKCHTQGSGDSTHTCSLGMLEMEHGSTRTISMWVDLGLSSAGSLCLSFLSMLYDVIWDNSLICRWG